MSSSSDILYLYMAQQCLNLSNCRPESFQSIHVTGHHTEQEVHTACSLHSEQSEQIYTR